MDFYFAFDTKISYSCKKCGSLCCNLNAELEFTPIQMSNYKLIPFRDFFKNNNGKYLCKSPKKCWFIKNEACILDNNKPFYCKLYPLNLYKLSEELIIIEFIPCPSTYIGENNIKKYKSIAMDYISFNNIVYHPKINKLANFKIDTNKFKIITNLIDLTLLKIKNKTAILKLTLFDFIIINSSIFMLIQ